MWDLWADCPSPLGVEAVVPVSWRRQDTPLSKSQHTFSISFPSDLRVIIVGLWQAQKWCKGWGRWISWYQLEVNKIKALLEGCYRKELWAYMDILRSDFTPLLVQLRVLGSWWHLLKYSYGQMDILNQLRPALGGCGAMFKVTFRCMVVVTIRVSFSGFCSGTDMRHI